MKIAIHFYKIKSNETYAFLRFLKLKSCKSCTIERHFNEIKSCRSCTVAKNYSKIKSCKSCTVATNYDIK